MKTQFNTLRVLFNWLKAHPDQQAKQQCIVCNSSLLVSVAKTLLNPSRGGAPPGGVFTPQWCSVVVRRGSYLFLCDKPSERKFNGQGEQVHYSGSALHKRVTRALKVGKEAREGEDVWGREAGEEEEGREGGDEDQEHQRVYSVQQYELENATSGGETHTWNLLTCSWLRALRLPATSGGVGGSREGEEGELGVAVEFFKRPRARVVVKCTSFSRSAATIAEDIPKSYSLSADMLAKLVALPPERLMPFVAEAIFSQSHAILIALRTEDGLVRARDVVVVSLSELCGILETSIKWRETIRQTPRGVPVRPQSLHPDPVKCVETWRQRILGPVHRFFAAVSHYFPAGKDGLENNVLVFQHSSERPYYRYMGPATHNVRQEILQMTKELPRFGPSVQGNGDSDESEEDISPPLSPRTETGGLTAEEETAGANAAEETAEGTAGVPAVQETAKEETAGVSAADETAGVSAVEGTAGASVTDVEEGAVGAERTVSAAEGEKVTGGRESPDNECNEDSESGKCEQEANSLDASEAAQEESGEAAEAEEAKVPPPEEPTLVVPEPSAVPLCTPVVGGALPDGQRDADPSPHGARTSSPSSNDSSPAASRCEETEGENVNVVVPCLGLVEEKDETPKEPLVEAEAEGGPGDGDQGSPSVEKEACGGETKTEEEKDGGATRVHTREGQAEESPHTSPKVDREEEGGRAGAETQTETENNWVHQITSSPPVPLGEEEGAQTPRSNSPSAPPPLSPDPSPPVSPEQPVVILNPQCSPTEEVDAPKAGESNHPVSPEPSSSSPVEKSNGGCPDTAQLAVGGGQEDENGKGSASSPADSPRSLTEIAPATMSAEEVIHLEAVETKRAEQPKRGGEGRKKSSHLADSLSERSFVSCDEGSPLFASPVRKSGIENTPSPKFPIDAQEERGEGEGLEEGNEREVRGGPDEKDRKSEAAADEWGAEAREEAHREEKKSEAAADEWGAEAREEAHREEKKSEAAADEWGAEAREEAHREEEKSEAAADEWGAEAREEAHREEKKSEAAADEWGAEAREEAERPEGKSQEEKGDSAKEEEENEGSRGPDQELSSPLVASESQQVASSSSSSSAQPDKEGIRVQDENRDEAEEVKENEKEKEDVLPHDHRDEEKDEDQPPTAAAAVAAEQEREEGVIEERAEAEEQVVAAAAAASAGAGARQEVTDERNWQERQETAGMLHQFLTHSKDEKPDFMSFLQEREDLFPQTLPRGRRNLPSGSESLDPFKDAWKALREPKPSMRSFLNAVKDKHPKTASLWLNDAACLPMKDKALRVWGEKRLWAEKSLPVRKKAAERLTILARRRVKEKNGHLLALSRGVSVHDLQWKSRGLLEKRRKEDGRVTSSGGGVDGRGGRELTAGFHVVVPDDSLPLSNNARAVRFKQNGWTRPGGDNLRKLFPTLFMRLKVTGRAGSFSTPLPGEERREELFPHDSAFHPRLDDPAFDRSGESQPAVIPAVEAFEGVDFGAVWWRNEQTASNWYLLDPTDGQGWREAVNAEKDADYVENEGGESDEEMENPLGVRNEERERPEARQEEEARGSPEREGLRGPADSSAVPSFTFLRRREPRQPRQSEPFAGEQERKREQARGREEARLKKEEERKEWEKKFHHGYASDDDDDDDDEDDKKKQQEKQKANATPPKPAPRQPPQPKSSPQSQPKVLSNHFGDDDAWATAPPPSQRRPPVAAPPGWTSKPSYPRPQGPQGPQLNWNRQQAPPPPHPEPPQGRDRARGSPPPRPRRNEFNNSSDEDDFSRPGARNAPPKNPYDSQNPYPAAAASASASASASQSNLRSAGPPSRMPPVSLSPIDEESERDAWDAVPAVWEEKSKPSPALPTGSPPRPLTQPPPPEASVSSRQTRDIDDAATNDDTGTIYFPDGSVRGTPRVQKITPSASAGPSRQQQNGPRGMYGIEEDEQDRCTQFHASETSSHFLSSPPTARSPPPDMRWGGDRDRIGREERERNIPRDWSARGERERGGDGDWGPARDGDDRDRGRVGGMRRNMGGDRDEEWSGVNARDRGREREGWGGGVAQDREPGKGWGGGPVRDREGDGEWGADAARERERVGDRCEEREWGRNPNQRKDIERERQERDRGVQDKRSPPKASRFPKNPYDDDSEEEEQNDPPKVSNSSSSRPNEERGRPGLSSRPVPSRSSRPPSPSHEEEEAYRDPYDLPSPEGPRSPRTRRDGAGGPVQERAGGHRMVEPSRDRGRRGEGAEVEQFPPAPPRFRGRQYETEEEEEAGGGQRQGWVHGRGDREGFRASPSPGRDRDRQGQRDAGGKNRPGNRDWLDDRGTEREDDRPRRSRR
uniref:Uncharacterized protein n=1 Tax=Chromera velia CCMP2878 TaxID=1169474 RepID=A0A0G4IFL7_9ALVE|eukprot:Cvel_14085.t1-p1 / transcript=Cvel_14085.t1 / gene=Cvel_14085 / organism=Chromera_velia_CCMP2878 / gene_product=hypothetical protein / transcript_product=hypothetical protein / location=Cvel_scaffold989:24177-32916(+) / protein_length=2320 / sequence_SO=supercontig / SO=protein_coding / is_pseudo=false